MNKVVVFIKCKNRSVTWSLLKLDLAGGCEYAIMLQYARACSSHGRKGIGGGWLFLEPFSVVSPSSSLLYRHSYWYCVPLTDVQTPSPMHAPQSPPPFLFPQHNIISDFPLTLHPCSSSLTPFPSKMKLSSSIAWHIYMQPQDMLCTWPWYTE